MWHKIGGEGKVNGGCNDLSACQVLYPRTESNNSDSDASTCIIRFLFLIPLLPLTGSTALHSGSRNGCCSRRSLTRMQLSSTASSSSPRLHKLAGRLPLSLSPLSPVLAGATSGWPEHRRLPSGKRERERERTSDAETSRAGIKRPQSLDSPSLQSISSVRSDSHNQQQQQQPQQHQCSRADPRLHSLPAAVPQFSLRLRRRRQRRR